MIASQVSSSCQQNVSISEQHHKSFLIFTKQFRSMVSWGPLTFTGNHTRPWSLFLGSSHVDCLKVKRHFEGHSARKHVDQDRNSKRQVHITEWCGLYVNYSKQIISVVGSAIHHHFLTNPFLMKRKRSIWELVFFSSKFKERGGHWQLLLSCFLATRLSETHMTHGSNFCPPSLPLSLKRGGAR